MSNPVVDESPIVLQPEVTVRQKTRNDNDNDNGVNDSDNDSDNVNDGAISPWFCYRLILALLLAMVVCFAGLVFSCHSFRYDRYGDQYYGFRGATSTSTTNNGRCVDWKIQNEFEWNDTWTNQRMPTLYTIGIVGFALIVAITLFWMAYGLVLKSSRERRHRHRHRREDQPPPVDASCAAIAPVVVVGTLLLVVGLLMFVTIMGNCRNIPRLSPGDVRCDFWIWSSLAMFASIVSCVIGCTLFSGLICCCCCACCERLRGLVY